MLSAKAESFKEPWICSLCGKRKGPRKLALNYTDGKNYDFSFITLGKLGSKCMVLLSHYLTIDLALTSSGTFSPNKVKQLKHGERVELP